jgi:hypothetical protein
MANTTASGRRIAWTYTNDLGVSYRVGAKKTYVVGRGTGNLGGTAAAATLPRLPDGYKVRQMLASATGHPSVWVPVYSLTAYAWTHSAASLVLTVNGVDVDYLTKTLRREERRPRDSTRQTA